MAGGKRVKLLASALFQTAVLGNWLRTTPIPGLRQLLSWPRSLLSREGLSFCCRNSAQLQSLAITLAAVSKMKQLLLQQCACPGLHCVNHVCQAHLDKRLLCGSAKQLSPQLLAGCS